MNKRLRSRVESVAFARNRRLVKFRLPTVKTLERETNQAVECRSVFCKISSGRWLTEEMRQAWSDRNLFSYFKRPINARHFGNERFHIVPESQGSADS